MKIRLIAPYKESPSISMHVYANNLKTVYTTLWHDVEIIAYPLRKITPSAKLNDQLTRYVMYPIELFRRSLKERCVYHIVDHSYAYLTACMRGTIVVTCHDLIPLKFKERVGRLAYTVFYGIILFLKWATTIIVDSTSTKQDLIDVIGKKYTPKIHTVPLGYNEKIFFRADGVKTNHNPERFKLLLVGKHFYKNIPNILQWIALLPSEMRKHIEIIKVLDFTSEEREFIRTHLSDVPCTEYARVTQEDIGKVYREADALIFASIYEGFGMPIVEAMACGTPVITSNCSSMPEVWGDAVLYVDPYTPQEIADSIAHLRNDKKHREELIKKWLERAKQFTWESVAKQVLSHYA